MIRVEVLLSRPRSDVDEICVTTEAIARALRDAMPLAGAVVHSIRIEEEDA